MNPDKLNKLVAEQYPGQFVYLKVCSVCETVEKVSYNPKAQEPGYRAEIMFPDKCPVCSAVMARTPETYRLILAVIDRLKSDTT